jgi:hypothetical protein
MVTVLTVDPATQLVNLPTEVLTKSYERITGVVDEIEDVIGVLKEIGDLKGDLELLTCDFAGTDVFNILTFATSAALVQEVGASLTTPAFTASYDETPTLVELNDSDGSPTKDVTATPTAFTSDQTFTKIVNNAQVVFTLDAARGAVVDQEQVTVDWQPKVFWGVEAAGLLTEAQIEALAGNALAPIRDRVFSVNSAGPTDYVWYCFPQSYDPSDASVFQVGAFAGGFVKMGVVSVTNPNGVVQDYACWRSDFPQLGSISVTVT